VSGDVMMCRWGVAKDQTVGKRVKLAVTNYRGFMQGLLIRFWVNGQYKTRTTGAVIFVSLRLNVISVLYLKDVWLEWEEMSPAGEEGVGIGGQLPPK